MTFTCEVWTRVAAIGLVLAGCGNGTCSSSELTDALAAAEPGDVVLVGSCEIAGAFVVPAGVTVRGAGESSVLASIEGGAVLDVAGDGAHIESLSIHVDHGYYGIRAVGVDDVVIDGVGIVVTRGMAVGLRDGRFTMSSVSMNGPIDAENAAAPPFEPELTGAFGVVGQAAAITLEDVHASGFAVAAIVLVDGRLTWTDDDDAPDIDATLGVGVLLLGSSATLDGVELGGMLSGFMRPGFAIVAARGSTASMLDAVDVSIEGGEGYGVLADEAELQLSGVTIENLGLVGVHAQGGTLLAVDVTLRANGGAGLAALDVNTMLLERVTASAQRIVNLASDATTAPVGDGLHVRRTSTAAAAIDLRATDLVLEDNERTGLLIDGADTAPARLELARVRTLATGTANGAIAQRAIVATDWDAEVVREGVAAANDAAFIGIMDPVGLVMPPAILTPMP